MTQSYHKKPRRKGLKFAVIGIIIGLAIGFGIKAVESIIAQQLVNILSEEAQKACNCEFKSDAVKVSLLSLTGVATNARLVLEGTDRLIFKKIVAKFSLAQIKEKIIELTDLHLIDGLALNVDEDSATYKFIDSLSTPLPPEQQKADRWRLKLDVLRVSDSKFIQDYSETQVEANRITMRMDRNSADDFVLRPAIGKLDLLIKSDKAGEFSRRISFGRVKSIITLQETKAIFEKLRLNKKPSQIKALAESLNKQGNKLSGSVEYVLSSAMLQLDSFLKGNISGTGSLAGSLGQPAVKGTLNMSSDEALQVYYENYSLFSLDQLKGDYNYALKSGEHNLSINNLSAESQQAKVIQTQPVTIKDKEISGALKIEIAEMFLEQAKFQNLVVGLDLSQDLDRLGLKLKANIGQASIGFFSLPQLFVEYVHTDRHTLNIQHSSAEYGSIKVNSEFDSDEKAHNKSVADQLFSCELNNFALILPGVSKSAEEEFTPETLRLTGKVDLTGVNSLASLNGTGNLTVTSDFFTGESALNSSLKIEQGKLTASLYNLTQSLNANLVLNLAKQNQPSSLLLKLNNFKPTEYSPAASCVNVSANLNYDFNVEQADLGSGQLQFEQLVLGCEPYTVKLAEPYRLPIKAGQIYFNNFSLLSKSTNFKVNGQAGLQSVNLRAEGDLLLNSILGFFPYLDDLVGEIECNINVGGTLGSPSLSGQAEIQSAEFSSEQLDLDSTNISGLLKLAGTKVLIGQLSGIVNGGQVSASGEVDFMNLAKSNFSINFTSITVDSIPDTTLQFSGVATVMQSDLGRPVISGNILIDQLEVLKEFKPLTIITGLLDQFSPFKSSTGKSKHSSSSPEIDLALEISAPRNILITSDFLTAELSANITVKGQASQPLITGQLETLSGWLGLKNKRFEITSGGLIFKETSLIPELNIIGETAVFSRTGEFVTIVLEATGALTNPRIVLSSDSGFSQNELLTLLTGNVRELESTRANRFSSGTSGSALEFFDYSEDDQISSFLNRLTAIDELAIEPALNSRTGSVEPVLAATKYLTNHVALIGESFLGPEGYSRVKGRVDILPKVSLVGSIDSLTINTNSSFGFDVIYTVLAKRTAFIDYKLQGNNSFSDDELLKAIRLNDNSRLSEQDIANLVRVLKSFYVDRGYIGTEITAECGSYKSHCTKLLITVEEGQKIRIGKRVFTGQPLPKEFSQNKIPELSSKLLASKRILEREQKRVLNMLRTEGYISARVNARYIATDNNSANLELDIYTGPQQSFIFKGNKYFTATDFLNTINLFKRRQPFGRNTINILTENIERLYREAGFLYVTIAHDKEESIDGSKIVHRINIKEEHQVYVTEVEFQGNDLLATNKIHDLLKRFFPERIAFVFNPEILIAEQVEENITALKLVYKRAGFVGTSVKYKIEHSSADKNLKIVYQIKEGSEQLYQNLTVVGWEELDKLPEMPSMPVSIADLNDYSKAVKLALTDLGYLHAKIALNVGISPAELELQIDSGTACRIADIQIEGLVSVAEDTVRKSIRLQAGDNWDTRTISSARSALLSLSLFSRIELLPRDGKLDSLSEVLLIRLIERPLRTLELGGGVNSELGVHFFGEATDRELFLDGRSISLRADAYFDQVESNISQGIASLRYSHPNFWEENLKLTQDFRFQKAELSTLEYDIDRIVSDTSIYHNFDQYSSGSLAYVLSQDSLKDVSTGAIISDLDQGVVELAQLNASLRWDWRDNPVLPNEGYTLSIDPSWASDLIGSDANYYSVGSRFSGIHPFGSTPFSLAHNTRVSSAWGYDNTENIPITQRYYLGGRQSIRGFRENSLGPKGEDGSIIGGDFLFSNNFELRYRFQETFSTHAFFDIGNVYLQDRSIDLGDLRQSVGVGLRYLSPIGPIGFDLGHPLDEQPGEPSVRLHFSIGAVF